MFPKTNLPLNIFEKRYLDLVNEAYDNNKLMGMVQSQKSGNEVYKVGCLGKISDFQKSNDGTIKNAVKLHDNLVVESVLIPTETRTTACVSSQVGCSLDCKFCATAKIKRMRNLNADEIYDQVVAMDQQSRLYFDRPLSNIVFMGMGEPLMNYKNLINAIDKITQSEGLGMSPSRITVSTSGIPKMMMKLADDQVRFGLAVSLHSARQSVREKLMPFAEKFPLEDLTHAIKYWYEKTAKAVTYEYVVWNCLLYTSPSPRDATLSRMPSSA